MFHYRHVEKNMRVESLYFDYIERRWRSTVGRRQIWFGGSLQSDVAEKSSEFLHQLKTIDVEPRRQYNFDVWQFWMQRRHTHPELWAVVMVVLTTSSNQVSVEIVFSPLSLILSDHRTWLGEVTLADILIIKLNPEVYEIILPNLLQKNETQ